MICAEATIGSTPPHGREPCVCRPFTMMREAVRARHHRARAIADHAGGERCDHVQAEHRLGLRDVEQRPRPSMRLAPPRLALGRAFLGRLKDEQHLARQLLAHAGERFGDAEQDRDVAVVAAGVHHADGFAAELRRDVGLERQSTCSVTGSASMSARSAIVGRAAPPRSSASDAGHARCRSSLPSRARAGAWRRRSAVRTSRLLSSGCW